MHVSKAQKQLLPYVSFTDHRISAGLFIIKNELETRAKELEAEESEIADQRDRLEADRAIDFLDELDSDAVSPSLALHSNCFNKVLMFHLYSSSSQQRLQP